MKWDWKAFIRAALIRGLRTFAQTFCAGITVGALWTEVQWIPALSAAGVGFVYSILMSLITGLPETELDKKQPPDGEEE